MPFVQRVIEPKYLSRTSLWDVDGNPRVTDNELEAVTNNTLSNALRQLASLVLVANDIFADLGGQLQLITKRSDALKQKIVVLEDKVSQYDPKKVTVPESDICTFSRLKKHYESRNTVDTNLFSTSTRPQALQQLYEAAAKTPVHLMRQLDRWRRDGHRSSRFFLCTPVLGAKRRKIRNKANIDIETRMPAAVEELRRWTSTEALGDITVTPDGINRIAPNYTMTDGELSDGTIASDDEAIDHKLPSPEEQVQVVALKFPAEIVAVDISGRSFDRMSMQRRSLLHNETNSKTETDGTVRRRTRTRKPRSRRRNTLAGTDQKEIQNALSAGEELTTSATVVDETETPNSIVCRSKSSDLLRSTSKKESPEVKKSHFNSLKQWGKNRLKMMNKSSESKSESKKDIDDINIYETVTMKRKRNIDNNRRFHERNPSESSSEKYNISGTSSNPLSSVMNVVKLRESSAQRRLRRSGGNKDEPHSSSGNWSASSESGRASIGSEITTTTHPKSTTSTCTSNNSLNQHLPGSVNSRRKFQVNTSTSGSITSEGTLTPDIIHDLHEDGETSSIYSCDTEGYYTSFHMDSGLKTLKEEELPITPLHSTTAFSNSGSNSTVMTAENEYELFGKGSTSTTTSSAGTVCTTLRASESNRSLIIGPAVPERKSSLSTRVPKSPESSLERDFSSDKTGTVKRSPASNKATVVAVIHKQTNGDVSPDSGHNTSSSPIESINSPNGVRSGSEFEFSESSDMEGADRIERIRVKTAINSSRIPSMCVITPPHSDDESVKSLNTDYYNKSKPDVLGSLNIDRPKLELPLKHTESEINVLKSSDSDKENQSIHTRIITSNLNGTSKMHLINVNQQSGYATVQTIEPDKENKSFTGKTVRAASPSGGNVVVKNDGFKPVQTQPILKASLMPLNNMFGRLKSNFATFTSRKESKTPEKECFNNDDGEYVTIADVRNNNEKKEVMYANNDVVNRNLGAVLSGKIRETEYVSLNELPCNDSNAQSVSDSLERKKRGARVTLDAEGKVVYSSDSLRRRKGAHTTFDPGPCVKTTNETPNQSPVPVHRTPKTVRPVQGKQEYNEKISGLTVPINDSNRPLSPQFGKVVIKASSGTSSSEIIRMPPSTIVTPSTRPMSPKSNTRGAYVHMQDTGRSLSPTHEKERVPSPSNHPMYNMTLVNQQQNIEKHRYYNQPDENYYKSNVDNSYGLRGSPMYRTLPTRKSQMVASALNPERSITPDITRGLDSKIKSNLYNQDIHNRPQYYYKPNVTDNKYNTLPHVPSQKYHTYSPPSKSVESNIVNTPPQNEALKISPIDPRNSGGFYSSTPSSKTTVNLESILLSPKKSTMSNEELYAVIHKSKKKLNINDGANKIIPAEEETPSKIPQVKSPETGYLGNKSKSRLSWSPNKGDYVDFNSDIDNISPNNESRSRQSWACSDRKGNQQTSRLDFKKLLLQHGTKGSIIPNKTKKLSAVEQLKLSKQQLPPVVKQTYQQPEMSILELSRSPRSSINRKMQQENPLSSPKHQEKNRPVPKLMSPRSQWRFANPRSDVLSSTILEDCREDESPNSSAERKKSTNNQGCITTSNITASDNKTSTNTVRKQLIPETPTNSNIPLSIAQKNQAQRAQFFNLGVEPSQPDEDSKKPTLETAF